MSKTIFNYESLVHATAGAAGSIVAMVAIYPLDTIKFRVQLEDDDLVEKTTLESLIHIMKEEGLESLYRGIKPVLASLGVSNFVYFYSFHVLKSLQPLKYETTAKSDLFLSTVAGILNALITNPLWVVNNRLKLAQPHEQPPYRGLLDGMLHIAKTEGLPALWSSLGPSLLLVSNPAIHFTVYEALKRRISTKSALAYFLMGAAAKTVATVATYPLQLAQTRQRTSQMARVNTAALLLSILKRNGVEALYQGLEAKLLQTVFTAALMFMTYEKIAQFVFKILLRKRAK